MKKDSQAYLQLILEAIEKIKAYKTGMDFSDFSRDGKTQSAVLMQLHNIGELAKKVSDDIKFEVNLPWKKVAGLRDMISHDYFDLDIEFIWKTVSENISEAEDEIKKYLENRE